MTLRNNFLNIKDVENNNKYYELHGVNFYDYFNDKVLASHNNVRVFKVIDNTDTIDDQNRAKTTSEEDITGLYDNIFIAAKKMSGKPDKPKRLNEKKFQRIDANKLLFFDNGENVNPFDKSKQLFPYSQYTNKDNTDKDNTSNVRFIKSLRPKSNNIPLVNRSFKKPNIFKDSIYNNVLKLIKYRGGTKRNRKSNKNKTLKRQNMRKQTARAKDPNPCKEIS